MAKSSILPKSDSATSQSSNGDERRAGSLDQQISPDNPKLVLFLGGVFRHLGGSFHVEGDGKRSISTPCDSEFLIGGLPQFADAKPHEEFQSDIEWRGALKLVDYFIHRLSRSDKDYLFSLSKISMEMLGKRHRDIPISPDIVQDGELNMLPECLELALFLSVTLEQLGCTFILSDHAYCLSKPLCVRLLPDGRPQLKDARPHEEFQCDKELWGATKFIDYFIHRMSEADVEYVWPLMANRQAFERPSYDFREQVA